MNTKLRKALTIRIEEEAFEAIEELKWKVKMGQSELLRELVKIGLEVKQKEIN